MTMREWERQWRRHRMYALAAAFVLIIVVIAGVGVAVYYLSIGGPGGGCVSAANPCGTPYSWSGELMGQSTIYLSLSHSSHQFTIHLSAGRGAVINLLSTGGMLTHQASLSTDQSTASWSFTPDSAGVYAMQLQNEGGINQTCAVSISVT